MTSSSVIQVRIDQGLVVKIGCPMRFSSDNQEEKDLIIFCISRQKYSRT
jgi:hypothetical protein